MPDFHNHILRHLSVADLDALGSPELVTLGLRQPLEPDPDSQPFVYFIETGVASVVADYDGRMGVELAIVGREGFVGVGTIHGDFETPFHTFMQLEGSGLRYPAHHFADQLAVRPELRARMLRYARAFSVQIATTALANGRSTLDERLSRWLLMVSDRVGPSFNITHELISVMLAVRRSGVTLAIQVLEGKGLIRAMRGSIQIVDREGLIANAKASYGLAESEYERLLGRMS